MRTIVKGASLVSPDDRLSQQDFTRLADIIQNHCGIRMPPAKRTMVEGRLRKRARALNLPSVHEYCRHIFDDGALDEELVNLIDAITTNKTDFFREEQHFRFLSSSGIQALTQLPHRPGRDRPMKVWSAACSTGAEPYTLAMVFLEWARLQRDFRFEIFATDICTDVLARAKRAVYPEEMARAVSPDLAARYLRRSRNRDDPTIRLVPEVRRSVHFGHLNLMDPSYPMATDMDVIFCRNILIYFDKPTQLSVLKKLCDHLSCGGYLFVGHSETISGLDLPVSAVAPSIFART
ncbi:CheR family methyltransferase [Telmatospirillum siberiense]|uniref:Chemotaxis protein methyltransferase n=1 Tax=Telmatospirillum siberiense TaxID=382514 RepID=A0A2N3PXA3_9PROT|nr:CheR family methyltransferase [Telmatospirillum siberiense]PKU25005.1 chemotaxis protein CheR [Telmatospirillum siberiense]